jgi:hypothetical protein
MKALWIFTAFIFFLFMYYIGRHKIANFWRHIQFLAACDMEEIEQKEWNRRYRDMNNGAESATEYFNAAIVRMNQEIEKRKNDSNRT